METKSKRGRKALGKVVYYRRVLPEMVEVLDKAILGVAPIVKAGPKACVSEVSDHGKDLAKYYELKETHDKLIKSYEACYGEKEALEYQLNELLNNPEGEGAILWKAKYDQVAALLKAKEDLG